MEGMHRRVTDKLIRQIQPGIFVDNAIRFSENRLCIGDREFELNKNVTVFGFGKAALGMYQPIKRYLGDHIRAAYLSVPSYNPHLATLGGRYPELVVCPYKELISQAAEHNMPDTDTVSITRAMVQCAEGLGDEDIALCLISGGGSALLCDPKVPLKDMIVSIKLLVSRSATIQQLNTVRTALCGVKGGGLARYISPATVASLIISDVIGDPLKFIASGPTCPSEVTAGDVLNTLKELGLSRQQLPLSVQHILELPAVPCVIPRNNIYNHIIASNKIALDIAKSCVEDEGYFPVVVTDSLTGEARKVARELIASIYDIYEPDLPADIVEKIRTAFDSEEHGKICLILGGETTVTLSENAGRGGRCQELALAAAIQLGAISNSSRHVTLLATSTDGQDGPTDASGAVVSSHTAIHASSQGLDMQGFLQRNDSYSFFMEFNGGRSQLRSGLTGTNLMDVILVFIDKVKCPESFVEEYPGS